MDGCNKRILVIEDKEPDWLEIQQALRLLVGDPLIRRANTTNTAKNLYDDEKAYKDKAPDLVLLDLRLHEADREGQTGLDLLKFLLGRCPGTPVILISAIEKDVAVTKGLNQGATGFIHKPVNANKLQTHLSAWFLDASKAPAIPLPNSIQKRLEPFATSVFPILITGTTGTGKTYLAEVLHSLSDRRTGPFISLNCNTIAESLFESEAFGVEKNVATGVDQRPGKFRMAEGGTLFLDEIGDLAVKFQAKLLTFLESGVIEPVGGQPLKVDVRIIAATEKDLRKAMERNEFRQALYYRLSTLVLDLPDLKYRVQDVEYLVPCFLEKERNAQARKMTWSVSPEAMQRLREYDWPGNIRELQNVLRRAITYVPKESNLICPEHVEFDDYLAKAPNLRPTLPPCVATVEGAPALPPSTDWISRHVSPKRPYDQNAALMKLSQIECLRNIGTSQQEIIEQWGICRATYYRDYKECLCLAFYLDGKSPEEICRLVNERAGLKAKTPFTLEDLRKTLRKFGVKPDQVSPR
jgi:DNA-binding NtrC family response regulator